MVLDFRAWTESEEQAILVSEAGLFQEQEQYQDFFCVKLLIFWINQSLTHLGAARDKNKMENVKRKKSPHLAPITKRLCASTKFYLILNYCRKTNAHHIWVLGPQLQKTARRAQPLTCWIDGVWCKGGLEYVDTKGFDHDGVGEYHCVKHWQRNLNKLNSIHSCQA